MRISARSIVAVATSALLYTGSGAAGDTMTNADIIKLVNAGMSNAIILSTIRGASETAFDTSVDQLIALKSAGVADEIIEEMANPQAAAKSKANIESSDMSPEEVIAIDAGTKIPMRYLTPNIRTANRALGWGGVANYAALRGPTAMLRLTASPTFLIIVPNNAQPQSYVTLIKLAQRRNNTREILISGGSGFGMSSGFPGDRVINMTVLPIDDQSKAPEKFTAYEVTPSTPLTTGEFAVVLASGEAKNFGFFAGATSDTFFDFGVD